jgi:hypothetical protein
MLISSGPVQATRIAFEAGRFNMMYGLPVTGFAPLIYAVVAVVLVVSGGIVTLVKKIRNR